MGEDQWGGDWGVTTFQTAYLVVARSSPCGEIVMGDMGPPAGPTSLTMSLLSEATAVAWPRTGPGLHGDVRSADEGRIVVEAMQALGDRVARDGLGT